MSFYTSSFKEKTFSINILIACFILSAFSFVGIINYFYDPLSIFSFNGKTYASSERPLKYNYSKKQKKFDVIILGSSKAAAIQLNMPELKNKAVFNFSFSAALPEEIKYLLENQNIESELIVLALDYFMFNENYEPYKESQVISNEFGRYDFLGYLDYLFSSKTFFYSLRNQYFLLKNKEPRYTSLGARNIVNREEKDFKVKIKNQETLKILQDQHFANYEISEKRLKALKEICEYASRENKKLIYFLNPYHCLVKNLINETIPHNELISAIKKQCPENIYMDFSRYNNQKYFFNSDPFHYYPSTGDIIIRNILNKK